MLADNTPEVNAVTIQARISWVILRNYNSNGYSGVVADEDKAVLPFRSAI